jgi:hypothetical protein
MSHEPPAAYNLYDIGGAPGAWTCEATARGLQADGAIGELARFRIA